MEDAFDKLKKQGKNDVDNLIKWMQDSKIIEKTKASEDNARKLFADAKDLKNIELPKFQQALAKLAEQQKKNVEEFTKILSAEAPKAINTLGTAVGAAIDAAGKAFKDAIGGGK